MLARQSATIRAASSAKPLSRAGRPIDLDEPGNASPSGRRRRRSCWDRCGRFRAGRRRSARSRGERRDRPVQRHLVAGVAADITEPCRRRGRCGWWAAPNSRRRRRPAARCRVGTMPRAPSVVAIGAASASAKARISGPAPRRRGTVAGDDRQTARRLQRLCRALDIIGRRRPAGAPGSAASRDRYRSTRRSGRVRSRRLAARRNRDGSGAACRPTRRAKHGAAAAAIRRSSRPAPKIWSPRQTAARAEFPDSVLRCWNDGSLRPVSAMTGLCPSQASCRPEARLAAPTDCAMQTPGLPVMRA